MTKNHMMTIKSPVFRPIVFFRSVLRFCLFILLIFSVGIYSHAQVNSVEFGKNRVQYQKFNWKFYQTDNFNTYFSQNGLELGKYVAQVAEKELVSLEQFIEYGMQRRANVVVYNSYDEMRQSNIGIGIDWQNAGGVTKLVNNKMLVYFDGNHEHLRLQIRQGIAQVLVQNMLFGDDLGEFAANQALLDLPEWLTDGYVSYAAERWSSDWDDKLKSALLSGRYNNFYQFAFEKPLLAGHAFWYYFGNKYGESKTTYMLYLARIYRNLNSASKKIAKQKFKEVLRDFMTEEPQKYYNDLRGRRVVPKGQLAVTKEITKKDYIRFNANPTPRSFTYAYVEFNQGKYCVVLMENFVNKKILLELGTRSHEDDKNPNYPILAWDRKGTRLACVYNEEGKTKLFVYDVVNRYKTVKNRVLPQFTQIQDMKYMLDENTLLLSAVKNGQTDIFVYKIDKETVQQVTDDVYDDLDASFVSFPNKTGIIYSSNRPSANAASSSDSLPNKHFNIFLVDNWNESDFKQISQLTNVNYGNARYPSQYNVYHFTFISDESGINNRYAGFFSTRADGLDTLVFIGDEVLRNPEPQDVDSTMAAWDKTDIDSVGFVSVSKDSTYVFPLSNYQSSLLETRTAGDNSQISEVVRQGDYKLLYRLRVDENTLRRRNVTVKPTEYRKKTIQEDRTKAGRQFLSQEPTSQTDSSSVEGDFFQNEFMDEKPADKEKKVGDVFQADVFQEEPVLKSAKLFEYNPPKFFSEYVAAGFNNNVLVTRWQPYGYGAGPIRLSNSSSFNGMLRVGTADLFEDWRITGGFRTDANFNSFEYLADVRYLKKRIDYGVTYYRNSQKGFFQNSDDPNDVTFGKQISNLYQGSFIYPLNRVKSVRINLGYRRDNTIASADQRFPGQLEQPNLTKGYLLSHWEFVHDDALNPALNIWKGLRYKVYMDLNSQISRSDVKNTNKPLTWNLGFDGRNYLPIYRNVIWATRVAADFSWGDQKMIFYAGGVDNDMFPKFNDGVRPDPDQEYAYQTLAVNLRGFNQNVANGNNAFILNSEVRMPVFSTLFNKPINNAFLRNFQLVQFIDLGTAWNGKYDNFERPQVVYSQTNNQVSLRVKAGGVGPLAGGYGFGARSTLFGYFLRFDAAWEMNGLFRGKPLYYFAMGFDF